MTAFDPFQHPEHLPSMARYRVIDRLSKIYDGTQYDGRPDWWTGCHRVGDKPVPLRQRKPCIRYKLGAAAVNQVVRFLFGDKRFPKLSVPYDDPETQVISEGDLKEADSKLLEKWLDDLVETAHLKPILRAAARKGIACKTAVMVLEAKGGDVAVTLPRPQDCYAEFEDEDPNKPVKRLVWCYQYDREVADPSTGKPKLERTYFRREWDAVNITEYAPIKVENSPQVSWGTPKRTPHGLSFCPVVWIRNCSEDANGIDGEGLYEGIEEDLEALDITLSRRHQGVVYLGAPQLVETGVEDGDGPEGATKKGPGGFSGGPSPHGIVGSGPPRRLSVEYAWTYQGKEVDVKLLETTGKAFEVATQHVDDIRSRCLESMGIVLTSMSDTVSRITTGAEMSAKFLMLAHAPLIALVQEYRHTWWPRGLHRVVSLLMRMVVDLAGGNQSLNIPGTDKAIKLLQSFYTGGKWQLPRIEPKWGRFFDSSTNEIKELVESATKAAEGSLIQSKTAVTAVAPEFGVEDIQAEISAIEEEEEEAQDRAEDLENKKLAAQHEMIQSLGKTKDSAGARPGMGNGKASDVGGRGPNEGGAAKRGQGVGQQQPRG